MGRPRVSLTVPPWTAELDLWGRDIGDEWWALIIWNVQTTSLEGELGPVWLAAWVFGQCVEQPLHPVDYLDVRRMRLSAEPGEWPAPVDRQGARWRGYYLGVLRDGEEPQLPAEAVRAWGHEQGGAYG